MSDFRVLNYILIGDPSVGKTSLVRNFLKKSFKSEHSSTIGLEFSSIKVKHHDKIYKIILWDTAGQERYHSIVRSYFKNALGAILVYDITNVQSMMNLESWLKDLRENGHENVSIVLVGNKNDLDQGQRREVEFQDGINFAKKHKLEFFAETSAVDGTNVETVFLETFKAISEKLDKGLVDVAVKEELKLTPDESTVKSKVKETSKSCAC